MNTTVTFFSPENRPILKVVHKDVLLNRKYNVQEGHLVEAIISIDRKHVDTNYLTKILKHRWKIDFRNVFSSILFNKEYVMDDETFYLFLDDIREAIRNETLSKMF